MKKNLLYLLALLFIGFAGVSCSDDDDPVIPPVIDETSCLIINQGNWNERNASISYYNETDSVVSNEAFIAVNGRRLAALAESGASNGTIGLVICNSPDKIEVIDINTAKTIANPITSDKLINPRYAVMTNDYAYVTCWGNPVQDGWWDEEHIYEKWIYPDSYIARIDLKTYTIKDTTPCGNDVEGIILLNNKLFVAVNNGIEAYNTSDMSKAGDVKHTSFYGNAKHLAYDKNGRIWYSVSDGGFVSVNVANVGNAAHMEINKEIAYANAQGYFTMNKDKSKLLFFTNESEEWVVTKSNIYALSVDSQTVNSQPIYQGNYINGIGVSPHSGKIYTAEIFGYTENSLLKIMDEDGKNMIVKEVGVAASRFVFFTPEN